MAVTEARPARPRPAPIGLSRHTPILIGTLLVGVPLLVFVFWPLATILLRSFSTPDGLGLDNYASILGTARFQRILWNSLDVTFVSTVHRRRGGLRARLRGAADPDAGQGGVPGSRADPAVRALPGPGPGTGPAVRAQRADQPHLRHLDRHLRLLGHRAGDGALRAALRLPDPVHDPGGGRSAALRIRPHPGRRAVADLSHHHPARLPLRHRRDDLRLLHAGDHRFRQSHGHRRELQRAGHRDLQPGHRPGQFRARHGHRHGAPGPGRRRRDLGEVSQPPAVRADLGPVQAAGPCGRTGCGTGAFRSGGADLPRHRRGGGGRDLCQLRASLALPDDPVAAPLPVRRAERHPAAVELDLDLADGRGGRRGRRDGRRLCHRETQVRP
jgi:hypothetical protein